MIWAVIKTGGKQYRVKPGQVLRVEKLSGDVGSAVVFKEVLLVADGEKVDIGTPLLSGIVVEGKIRGQLKGPKLTVFKFKSKVRYRVKTGHRQPYTEVEITKIGKASASAPTATKTAAPKPRASVKSQAPARKAPPKRAETRTRKTAK